MLRQAFRMLRGYRLSGDERGVALIEFAFALPVLVLMFVGSYQLSDGVSAYRKVTLTARTIADLTSQYTTVTNADLDMILDASQQVLSPYPVADASFIITRVDIDSTGGATVIWSRAKNTTAKSAGGWFYVPVAYKQNSTSIIVVDVAYTYTPKIASSLIGTIVLREQVTMSPRISATITKS